MYYFSECFLQRINVRGTAVVYSTLVVLLLLLLFVVARHHLIRLCRLQTAQRSLIISRK